jgi:short-subunit dehydrogenase involved in D-alanine esterification of teichoic acids
MSGPASTMPATTMTSSGLAYSAFADSALAYSANTLVVHSFTTALRGIFVS